jgi:hypothetical protein
MDHIQLVFKTLKDAPEPMRAGDIAEVSGLERKEVDKAMKVLKKDGRIVSPKNCFWTAG